nr:pantothenate kinase 2-like [Ipomoea batatas]
MFFFVSLASDNKKYSQLDTAEDGGQRTLGVVGGVCSCMQLEVLLVQYDMQGRIKGRIQWRNLSRNRMKLLESRIQWRNLSRNRRKLLESFPQVVLVANSLPVLNDINAMESPDIVAKAAKVFFGSSVIGDQIPAPSSPRDGDDVTITVGHPQVLIGFMVVLFLFSRVCEGSLDAAVDGFNPHLMLLLMEFVKWLQTDKKYSQLDTAEDGGQRTLGVVEWVCSCMQLEVVVSPIRYGRAD